MYKLTWRLFYILVSSTALFGFTSVFQLSWYSWDIRPTQNWQLIQRNRMDILNATCMKYKFANWGRFFHPKITRNLIVEHKHKLIFCEVPKTGCSNWKRIIFLLQNNLTTSPGNLTHEFIHNSTILTRLSIYPRYRQIDMLRKYTKVMFTRDPFQRLVSAYRNKFLHTEANAYYNTVIAGVIRQKFGNSSIRNGSVTFPAFVRYVLQGNSDDIHWNLVTKLCSPCSIQYDILGRFETLKEDANRVLKIIGAPDYLHFPDIKQHLDEVENSERLAQSYFRELNEMQLTSIVNRYRLDFSLFNYPIYITKETLKDVT